MALRISRETPRADRPADAPTQARESRNGPAREADGNPAGAGAPLVSVIIPTMRPDTLPRAILSVLKQTYRNFEILVVNDGGEDSRALTESFKDARVRYFRHETNLGVSAARNTGLRNARGKYIAYLDDDDYYFPEHLETLVSFLETSDARVAYTDGYCAHLSKRNGAWCVKNREIVHSDEFETDRLLVDNILPICGMMHERACIHQSGGFDEGLHIHEDWDLWIRLGALFPFKHIRKLTCEYTTREDLSNKRTNCLTLFVHTFQLVHERYKALAEGNQRVLRAQEELRRKARGWALVQLDSMSPEEIGSIPNFYPLMKGIVEGGLILRNYQDLYDTKSLLCFLLPRFPGDPQLTALYSRLLRAMGQAPEALGALRGALASRETPEALAEYVRVLEVMGLREEAAGAKERLRESFPESSLEEEPLIPPAPVNTSF